MSDRPQKVFIVEEGPREGFQFERGPILTEDKIRLIDALSTTGLRQIQTFPSCRRRTFRAWRTRNRLWRVSNVYRA